MSTQPREARDGVAFGFVPRASALEPLAVVGLGETARALGERVLASSDEALAAWRAVAGARVLVVLGEGASIPWVDGALYLGRDERAPRLYLPTSVEPTLDPGLVEAAVFLRAPALASPIALVASPPRLVSLAAARPIGRDRLRAWLEAAP